MFKRVVWMGAGFGAGLGSSFWVKRAVTRRVHRYVPPSVRTVVAAKARSAGTTVRGAVREGREVMRSFQESAEADLADERRRNLRLVNGD